jgi:membrane associated rhomboid family serine protease
VIPVADFARSRTKPYVNWTLIAINIAVFVYMLTLSADQTVEIGRLGLGSERDKFLFDYGFVAACLGREAGFSVSGSPADFAICPSGHTEFLRVFTSMFVHAGWAHIFGNMLFLWIFGDNVEDRMGHGRYLLFYLLCGIAAAALETFMAVDTFVPSVGASGAIAGVMGAYLVLYPLGRVRVVILPFFFLPFVIPAVVLIGFWFLMQLVSGIGEIGEATAGTGVAWWAHVGGFIAGLVLIWIFKRPQRSWRRWGQLTG